MSCARFEQRMQDLLDRRATAENDPELLGHAAECSKCRQRLAVQASLFAAPPKAIAGRTRKTKFGLKPIGHGRLAVAASIGVLCVAIGGVPFLWRWNDSSQVAKGSRHAAEAFDGEAESSDASLVVKRSAGSPPATDTRWEGDVAARSYGAPKRSRPSTSIGRLSSTSEIGSDDWETQTLRQMWQQDVPRSLAVAFWLDSFQYGLQPLTRSATSTLNVLKLTWPKGRTRNAMQGKSEAGGSSSI